MNLGLGALPAKVARTRLGATGHGRSPPVIGGANGGLQEVWRGGWAEAKVAGGIAAGSGGRQFTENDVGCARRLGMGMLGAPLRAGAAHVVPLGTVGAGEVGGQRLPQVGESLAQARSRGGKRRGGASRSFDGVGHDEHPVDRPATRLAIWSLPGAPGFIRMIGPN